MKEYTPKEWIKSNLITKKKFDELNVKLDNITRTKYYYGRNINSPLSNHEMNDIYNDFSKGTTSAFLTTNGDIYSLTSCTKTSTAYKFNFSNTKHSSFSYAYMPTYSTITTIFLEKLIATDNDIKPNSKKITTYSMPYMLFKIDSINAQGNAVWYGSSAPYYGLNIELIEHMYKLNEEIKVEYNNRIYKLTNRRYNSSTNAVYTFVCYTYDVSNKEPTKHESLLELYYSDAGVSPSAFYTLIS